jgi:hypothetical protein
VCCRKHPTEETGHVAAEDLHNFSDLSNSQQKYIRYRMKLVRNEKAYQKFKECDREKAKVYRKSLQGEKRARYNENARIRMKIHREKQKDLPKPKISDSEKKQLRAKWAEQKRIQRSKVTPEQKLEKEKNKLLTKLSSLPAAEFADYITSQVTPRKKKELKKRGLYQSPKTTKEKKIAMHVGQSVKRQVLKLKEKRDRISRTKLKIILSNITKYVGRTKVRADMNICWKTWQAYSKISPDASMDEIHHRKRRLDTMSPESTKSIQEYYEDQSAPLPLKHMAEKRYSCPSAQEL